MVGMPEVRLSSAIRRQVDANLPPVYSAEVVCG